ncbi:MAG TPA: Fur family transcriptional regulator [Candidatus Acidoferrum sp.]|jgi:Fur family ferric uptake transcriptional regulator|nr:Fur family transcriptional regulator [Candidatus Acidoferrum sp.]
MKRPVTAAPPLTKNQRLILEIIEQNGVGTHVTAYDLLGQAKERQPEIGLATIHRALNQLNEHGLIAKVLVPGIESATYEPIAEQHAHFRCRECGTVSDVDYAVPKRTLAELAHRLGHRIDEEQLTLAGVCSACLARAKGALKNS